MYQIAAETRVGDFEESQLIADGCQWHVLISAQNLDAISGLKAHVWRGIQRKHPTVDHDVLKDPTIYHVFHLWDPLGPVFDNMLEGQVPKLLIFLRLQGRQYLSQLC